MIEIENRSVIKFHYEGGTQPGVRFVLVDHITNANVCGWDLRSNDHNTYRQYKIIKMSNVECVVCVSSTDKMSLVDLQQLVKLNTKTISMKEAREHLVNSLDGDELADLYTKYVGGVQDAKFDDADGTLQIKEDTRCVQPFIDYMYPILVIRNIRGNELTFVTRDGIIKYGGDKRITDPIEFISIIQKHLEGEN